MEDAAAIYRKREKDRAKQEAKIEKERRHDGKHLRNLEKKIPADLEKLREKQRLELDSTKRKYVQKERKMMDAHEHQCAVHDQRVEREVAALRKRIVDEEGKLDERFVAETAALGEKHVKAHEKLAQAHKNAVVAFDERASHEERALIAKHEADMLKFDEKLETSCENVLKKADEKDLKEAKDAENRVTKSERRLTQSLAKLEEKLAEEEPKTLTE